MPTAQVQAQEPVSLRVKLRLPEEIVAQYETKARSMGMNLEALLARRLTDTINQNDQRPLYFTDRERMVIEKLLSRNFGNAGQVVDAISKLAKVSVGPTTVNLSEAVLARLRSRCPRNERLEDFIERSVLRLMEEFVGLR